MAPPPPASLPLTERLLTLAKTLQCKDDPVASFNLQALSCILFVLSSSSSSSSLLTPLFFSRLVCWVRSILGPFSDAGARALPLVNTRDNVGTVTTCLPGSLLANALPPATSRSSSAHCGTRCPGSASTTPPLRRASPTAPPLSPPPLPTASSSTRPSRPAPRAAAHPPPVPPVPSAC